MYIAICDSDVTVRREVKRIIKEKYNDVTVDEITGLQEYCINLCKQTRKIPDIIIVDVRWEKVQLMIRMELVRLFLYRYYILK